MGKSQIVEVFLNTRTDMLGWRMRHEAHSLCPQYDSHSLGNNLKNLNFFINRYLNKILIPVRHPREVFPSERKKHLRKRRDLSEWI
jgi:hypothetical protein